MRNLPDAWDPLVVASIHQLVAQIGTVNAQKSE